jgi:hypothetical protein
MVLLFRILQDSSSAIDHDVRPHDCIWYQDLQLNATTSLVHGSHAYTVAYPVQLRVVNLRGPVERDVLSVK